jgi:dihydrofolate reductase
VSISLVAAIGRRGELGRGGELVFRLKTDMANFRNLTRGKPLVMGRKTWDSFPKKPLPGRPNLIATRNLDFLAPGAFVYSSIPPALAAARAMAAKAGVAEVCVIGGAEIYAAALPVADRLWLTEVDAEVEADAFFPRFDRREWREASAVRFPAGEGNDFPFAIRELVRGS